MDGGETGASAAAQALAAALGNSSLSMSTSGSQEGMISRLSSSGGLSESHEVGAAESLSNQGGIDGPHGLKIPTTAARRCAKATVTSNSVLERLQSEALAATEAEQKASRRHSIGSLFGTKSTTTAAVGHLRVPPTLHPRAFVMDQGTGVVRSTDLIRPPVLKRRNTAELVLAWPFHVKWGQSGRSLSAGRQLSSLSISPHSSSSVSPLPSPPPLQGTRSAPLERTRSGVMSIPPFPLTPPPNQITFAARPLVTVDADLSRVLRDVCSQFPLPPGLIAGVLEPKILAAISSIFLKVMHLPNLIFKNILVNNIHFSLYNLTTTFHFSPLSAGSLLCLVFLSFITSSKTDLHPKASCE